MIALITTVIIINYEVPTKQYINTTIIIIIIFIIATCYIILSSKSVNFIFYNCRIICIAVQQLFKCSKN